MELAGGDDADVYWINWRMDGVAGEEREGDLAGGAYYVVQ